MLCQSNHFSSHPWSNRQHHSKTRDIPDYEMMLCSDGVTGFKSAAYTRESVVLLPIEIGPATDLREITIEVAARRAGRYTGV